MAAVTITFDGTRVADAESLTNWTAAGATPTLEPDFHYQNANCISAQVKTAEVGFYFRNAATSYNFSSPRRTALIKGVQSNKDALDGNGFIVEIGTGARSAYYQYYVFTATTYPIAGGWQIIPIDPNVSGYTNNTVGGGPTLSTIDMFGVRADCNATAKAPNLGMDAIDFFALGEGLTLTGGDGGSTPGTFQDFINEDEGTSVNRWGIVSTRDGVLYVLGTLSIGSGTAAMGFSDSNKVLVFPDGRFDTSFAGVKFNLLNVNSTGSISACVFRGRGAVPTSSVDTRPDFTAIGSLGRFGVTGSVFNTFRNMTLQSQMLMTECTFLSGARLFQSGASIVNCTIADATTSDANAFLFSDDPSRISSCDFTFSDGHAIQIMTAGTYTFAGNIFNGFGADGTNDAAIFNNTSGSVTLNITAGGSTPTVRNGTSATTSIVNAVSIDVHVEDTDGNAIQNAQVYVQKTSPTKYTAGAGNTAGNGTIVTTQTIDSDTPQAGTINVLDISESNGVSMSGAQSYRYASHDGANTFSLPTTITFACTGGGTSTALEDTVNSFITNLREGDTIRNTTDGSWAVVLEINSASSVTTSPLRGGTDNTWTSGDFYAINDLATTLVSGTDLIDVPILLDLTDSSGNVTKSFPFVSTRAVTIRVRHVDGPTKYIPVKTASNITSTGMSVSIVIQQDTVFT